MRGTYVLQTYLLLCYCRPEIEVTVLYTTSDIVCQVLMVFGKNLLITTGPPVLSLSLVGFSRL